MKKQPNKKNVKPTSEEKAAISKIIDEIIAECSPLPDTINLFNKIRQLEQSTVDYTPLLSKKFSKSTLSQQEFIVNHVFPHLKRFSLSESLNNLVQKETLAPRILIDILHFLIRADTIIDHQLLEKAHAAEELANQLATLLEKGFNVESQDTISTMSAFFEMPPSLQLGTLEELIHAKGEKTKPLILTVFNRDNKLGRKVIDYIGTLKDTHAISLLTSLLQDAKDKETAKSIKKTLYRLKNKGIEVALPETKGKVTVEKEKVPLPSPEAYATSIDPLGDRLIIAVTPTSPQEVTIYQFLVNDQRGITDLIVSLTTPKEYKHYITKLENTKSLRLVNIELPYCGFLIKEASHNNHASGTKIPDTFFLWKKFISKFTPSEKAEIYTLLDPQELRSRDSLLNGSVRLIKEYPFTFWLLEWKFLIDSYKEIYEAEHSLLILSEYQQEERIQEIVSKTARLFFNEKNRWLFQRRLEETAYVLWKIGKEEDAKCAFAAALAFTPEGVPSERHPFALKIVEENFNFLKEQAQKEKRSESGRIILP